MTAASDKKRAKRTLTVRVKNTDKLDLCDEERARWIYAAADALHEYPAMLGWYLEPYGHDISKMPRPKANAFIKDLMRLMHAFSLGYTMLAFETGELVEPGEELRSNAVKGAMAKLQGDKDGKQAAKRGALKLWLERENGLHPSIRTNEQFATEVMRRWPTLTSAKVICGWATQWRKTKVMLAKAPKHENLLAGTSWKA